MFQLCLQKELAIDFTFPVFCGRWKIMQCRMKLSQLATYLTLYLPKHCVERSLQIASYSLTFNIIDNAMLTLTIPILPTHVMISGQGALTINFCHTYSGFWMLNEVLKICEKLYIIYICWCKIQLPNKIKTSKRSGGCIIQIFLRSAFKT